MDKNDFVMINLDRPRKLRLGYKALKKMSEMLGKSISELDTAEFNAKQIETAMYCLLLDDAKENSETLKLESIEDLLDSAQIGEVMQKIGEAFQAGFGVTEPGETEVKNA
jgi:hypothetical protein